MVSLKAVLARSYYLEQQAGDHAAAVTLLRDWIALSDENHQEAVAEAARVKTINPRRDHLSSVYSRLLVAALAS